MLTSLLLGRAVEPQYVSERAQQDQAVSGPSSGNMIALSLSYLSSLFTLLFLFLFPSFLSSAMHLGFHL